MRAQRLIRWVSLFLLGAFGLLALDSLQLIGRYQNMGRALFAPFAWATSVMADHAIGVWDSVDEIGTLEQENQRLREQNRQLAQRNLELEALGRDNAEMRRLLNFKQLNPDHTYVPAGIIARGTNNLTPMLTLDEGSSNGLRVGMAVVDGGGLVGRLARVGSHNAVVTPIDNASSAVAAVVMGNDSHPSGVVQYEPGTGLLLNFVQATAPLRIGEQVVTSGLGGTFPRDLPVGTVRAIHQHPVELFQVAVLTPASDIANDRQVLVITDFVPRKLPETP